MDELKFRYYVYFVKEASDLIINILLRLGDDTMSVYYRHYDVEILNNSEYFHIAYDEFKEYLQNTNIVMNKKDLLFLNEQIHRHNGQLPNVYSITLDDFSYNPEKYINELTSKEILFLMFINGKRVNDKRFEDWEKEYHLNVAYLTKSLLEAGYITRNDYRKNMSKAKRSLLRTVMDDFCLEGFGDNNELMEIILEHVPEEKLKEYFSGTHYFLTQKGEQIVSKNRKLDDYSRSYYRHVDNMRLEEFHLLSIKRPNYNFQAICRLLIQNNESAQKEYIAWDQFIDDVIHDRLPQKEVETTITPPEKKRVEVFIDSQGRAHEPSNIREQSSPETRVNNNDDADEQIKTEMDHETPSHHERPSMEERQIIDLTTEDIGIIGDEKLLKQIDNYERRKSYYRTTHEIPTDAMMEALAEEEKEENMDQEDQRSRPFPLSLQLIFHLSMIILLMVIILSLLYQLDIKPINKLLDQLIDGIQKLFK